MAKHTRFGDILKAARMAQGLTQDQVEAKSGVSRSAISNIERGDGGTTIKTMVSLADALGFDLRIGFEPKLLDERPICDFKSFLETNKDIVLGFRSKKER